MTEVIAVNCDIALVLTDTGETLPMVNWINGEGECDPDDALGCVAGPDADGKWHVCIFGDFQPSALQ